MLRNNNATPYAVQHSHQQHNTMDHCTHNSITMCSLATIAAVYNKPLYFSGHYFYSSGLLACFVTLNFCICDPNISLNLIFAAIIFHTIRLTAKMQELPCAYMYACTYMQQQYNVNCTVSHTTDHRALNILTGLGGLKTILCLVFLLLTLAGFFLSPASKCRSKYGWSISCLQVIRSVGSIVKQFCSKYHTQDTLTINIISETQFFSIQHELVSRLQYFQQ
jgi:hypothetical protein